MTAVQIRANSPAGEIVLPYRGHKVKTPEGYIEAVEYHQPDGTARRVVLAEKGDTTNIRLPDSTKSGAERISYDDKRGTRGNTDAA